MPGAILGAHDVTVSKMADIPSLSGQNLLPIFQWEKDSKQVHT